MPTVGYGDRLRLLRRDLGLTTVEMAEQIGTTYGTLGRHEQLHDVPKMNTHMLANSIELRYGQDYPGGLAHWILTGHPLSECPAVASAPPGTRTPNPLVRGRLALVGGAA